MCMNNGKRSWLVYFVWALYPTDRHKSLSLSSTLNRSRIVSAENKNFQNEHCQVSRCQCTHQEIYESRPPLWECCQWSPNKHVCSFFSSFYIHNETASVISPAQVMLQIQNRQDRPRDGRMTQERWSLFRCGEVLIRVPTQIRYTNILLMAHFWTKELQIYLLMRCCKAGLKFYYSRSFHCFSGTNRKKPPKPHEALSPSVLNTKKKISGVGTWADFRGY